MKLMGICDFGIQEVQAEQLEVCNITRLELPTAL